MQHDRAQVQYPEVRIPKRHLPWFVQLLTVFAVVLIAGMVYGFWRISMVPSPTVDLPEQPTVTPPAELPIERPVAPPSPAQPIAPTP
jgi:hypothetical protein